MHQGRKRRKSVTPAKHSKIAGATRQKETVAVDLYAVLQAVTCRIQSLTRQGPSGRKSERGEEVKSEIASGWPDP